MKTFVYLSKLDPDVFIHVRAYNENTAQVKLTSVCGNPENFTLYLTLPSTGL